MIPKTCAGNMSKFEAFEPAFSLLHEEEKFDRPFIDARCRARTSVRRPS